MIDLQIARTRLVEEELTLVIVKHGEVLFETKSHRIRGFLDAIEELGEKLNCASLADRVVGKAIALLCAHAGVGHVYAMILSRKARDVLNEYNISVQWNELVETVLDANRTDVCPFEKTADKVSKPNEAYLAFKSLKSKMES